MILRSNRCNELSVTDTVLLALRSYLSLAVEFGNNERGAQVQSSSAALNDSRSTPPNG